MAGGRHAFEALSAAATSERPTWPSSFFDLEANKEAIQFPVTGIINDLRSKRYLVAPDYWNYWGAPRNPGYPVGQRVQQTAPPATWWAQREEWRDQWERLGTGKEVAASWPYQGRKSRNTCYEDPHLLPFEDRRSKSKALEFLKEKADVFGLFKKTRDGKPKHWWKWLELPESDNRPPKRRRFLRREAGCPKPVDLKHPAGDWESEYESADPFKKPFDPLKPPKLTWKQEVWTREHSLRRPTVPGYPYVLTPAGMRNAVPRLPRFAEENEAATIDPHLPRPAPKLNPDAVPYRNPEKAVFRVYDGKQEGGGILKNIGKAIAAKLVGGTKLEFLAFWKLIQAEPDWVKRYLRGQIVFDDLNAGTLPGGPAKTVQQALQLIGRQPGGAKAGAAAGAEVVEDNDRMKLQEPKWQPPAPPDFGEERRQRWLRFWRDFAAENHHAPEGVPVRAAGASMTRRWHALNDVRKPLAQEPPGQLMLQMNDRVMQGAKEAKKEEAFEGGPAESRMPAGALALAAPPAAQRRPDARRRSGCMTRYSFI